MSQAREDGLRPIEYWHEGNVDCDGSPSDLRLHFQCPPQVLIFEQVFVPEFTFQTFC
jgi:hypothetical protein